MSQVKVSFLWDDDVDRRPKLYAALNLLGAQNVEFEDIEPAAVESAGKVRAETPMVEKGPIVVRDGGRKYGPSFRD